MDIIANIQAEEAGNEPVCNLLLHAENQQKDLTDDQADQHTGEGTAQSGKEIRGDHNAGHHADGNQQSVQEGVRYHFGADAAVGFHHQGNNQPEGNHHQVVPQETDQRVTGPGGNDDTAEGKHHITDQQDDGIDGKD